MDIKELWICPQGFFNKVGGSFMTTNGNSNIDCLMDAYFEKPGRTTTFKRLEV